MAKNKLKKFEENLEFKHLIQPSREEVLNGFQFKGNWNKNFFKSENPIVLELGCGKGDYIVNLSKQNPNKNFIGIDIKGARLWKGAKTVETEKISNAGFLRTQIELLPYLFEKEEISEIWITFPDPQIKYRRAKHRLTHPKFLKMYFEILKKSGFIHLKTDSEFLHGYTHGVIELMNLKTEISNHDIYHPDTFELPKEVTEIQTFYEQRFIKEGKKITYIKFSQY